MSGNRSSRKKKCQAWDPCGREHRITMAEAG
jgi:hypothetical protein